MAKHFIIYEASGKIIRYGSCPDDAFDMQRQDDELIAEGMADGATQYMDVASSTLVEFPPKPSTYHEWNWTTKAWELPSTALDSAKSYQIAFLSNACSQAIIAGVISNALGTPHTYPTKPLDQTNMSASVLDSLLPNLPTNWATPFWCIDSGGNWAYQMHSAAQIQQAGADVKAHIVTQLTKNVTLQAQVSLCTSIEQVQQVVW